MAKRYLLILAALLLSAGPASADTCQIKIVIPPGEITAFDLKQLSAIELALREKNYSLSRVDVATSPRMTIGETVIGLYQSKRGEDPWYFGLGNGTYHCHFFAALTKMKIDRIGGMTTLGEAYEFGRVFEGSVDHVADEASACPQAAISALRDFPACEK